MPAASPRRYTRERPMPEQQRDVISHALLYAGMLSARAIDVKRLGVQPQMPEYVSRMKQ
jgi:hypothetical protein